MKYLISSLIWWRYQILPLVPSWYQTFWRIFQSLKMCILKSKNNLDLEKITCKTSNFRKITNSNFWRRPLHIRVWVQSPIQHDLPRISKDRFRRNIWEHHLGVALKQIQPLPICKSSSLICYLGIKRTLKFCSFNLSSPLNTPILLISMLYPVLEYFHSGEDSVLSWTRTFFFLSHHIFLKKFQQKLSCFTKQVNNDDNNKVSDYKS